MRSHLALVTLATSVFLALPCAAQTSEPSTPTHQATAPSGIAPGSAPTPTSATPSDASASSDAPVRHRHDERYRMYYSARLGVGHLATVAALDANSLRLVGVGTSLDLAIGTVIAPNLILRGVFGGSQVTNPTIEMNGRSAETQNVNMTQYWLGAGLAYYWMPLNATAGFSMMASRSSVRVDNSPDAVSTELGPAIALHVGKEWWVADRPALGVTAQAVWASMNDQEERGRQATVTSRSLSLAASLTYN